MRLDDQSGSKARDLRSSKIYGLNRPTGGAGSPMAIVYYVCNVTMGSFVYASAMVLITFGQGNKATAEQ